MLKVQVQLQLHPSTSPELTVTFSNLTMLHAGTPATVLLMFLLLIYQKMEKKMLLAFVCKLFQLRPANKTGHMCHLVANMA